MEVTVLAVLLLACPVALGATDDLRRTLKYFEVIHVKDLGHNIVKRGVHPSNHPFNKIREVNFKVRSFLALCFLGYDTKLKCYFCKKN